MSDDQSTPAPAPDQSPAILGWPYAVPAEDVVLCVTYPGLPLGKQRPRFGKGGRVYTPDETRRYESNLQALFLEKLRRITPDGDSRFALRCIFHRPTRQRIDCDNLMKAVSDAATGLVWKDDSQVLEIVGKLFIASASSRAEILIHRVPDTSGKKTCERCGKAIIVTCPSINAKYCSKECRYHTARITLNCPQCKQDFVIAQSVARRGLDTSGRVFCSRSCSMAYIQERRRESSGRADSACAVCGCPISKRKYKTCRACFLKQKPECSSNYWTVRNAV